MSDWQPIETLEMDGMLRLFHSPKGGTFIAPATVPRELTRQENVGIYENSGSFPHTGWEPTHWMPLPDPPKP